MFDSDNRRHLRKKYKGMQKDKNGHLSKANLNSNKGQMTVYEELKLSDLLNDQLNELKNRFDDIQEELEQTQYERD